MRMGGSQLLTDLFFFHTYFHFFFFWPMSIFFLFDTSYCHLLFGIDGHIHLFF